MEDHKHTNFCAKCGTKFPVEAPKAIYYSPSYKEVFEPTSPCPGDTVKYVQEEEAEFLKRQVKAQEGIIKKLMDESPKYNGKMQEMEAELHYLRMLKRIF